jgi:hypothetical protein
MQSKKMIAVLLLLTSISYASAYCNSDMSRIEGIAKSDSQGKSPDGMCYSHVADYIDASGYGGIDKNGFNDAIPPVYWKYAYQFAEYLNKGSNAADLCLKNVQREYSNNPYKAPTGSIVVVRAGTPGTANPVAGDIAIVGGGDYFWNGGEMGYGGSQNFPSNNDYVLGIYVPTSCVGDCRSSGDNDDSGEHCPSECQECVKYAGGKACADRCDGCSDACLNCINGGGGTACSSKCAPTVSVASHYHGMNMTSAERNRISHIPYRSYVPVEGSTCTGDHEFCCEAPNADASNCPPSAYTSDCAKKNSCCCA